MWLEAILAKEDFIAVASEVLPASVHLGKAESDHFLLLSAATDVELVEGRGLRIRCNAQLRWPVLSIDVPIHIDGLTILVEPRVEEGSGSLEFDIQLEHADVALLPSLLDSRIVDALNETLRSKRDALAWDFKQALSHDFPLPAALRPLDALGLQVAWGKVRVTKEAVVLAVSFHTLAIREGSQRAEPRSPAASQDLPVARFPDPPAPLDQPSPLSVAVATGLALTTTYVTIRSVFRLFSRHRALPRHRYRRIAA